MDLPLLPLLITFILGGGLVWLLMRPDAMRLRTAIEKEREAAAEKLRLLEDAQAKLSDAFRALSSEALRDNNQSFLHLAKATLEKFQETAKGDLELRQQAIGELVKPLRESLEKVDQKIQEIETARAVACGGLTDHLKGAGLGPGESGAGDGGASSLAP